MKPQLILCLALVLFMSTASFAAELAEFGADEIKELWPELWKQGAHEMKAPVVDPLSEPQVIKDMSGKWTVLNGSDKILISVQTNGQAAISGIKDGKTWEKSGPWKVVSNKLVLFLKDDELPVFIFRIKGNAYMYDPLADSLMSEMERDQLASVPLNGGLSNQPVQLPSIEPVAAKISKADVLGILDSIDTGLIKQDAAAVVANFASNAVITAMIVEGQRTDTTTNDTVNYRNILEAGFKSFDDYKIQRKKFNIQISSDRQKATSSSALIETYHFAGNAERAVTEESETFEIIGGKVVLTKMDSKVKVTPE